MPQTIKNKGTLEAVSGQHPNASFRTFIFAPERDGTDKVAALQSKVDSDEVVGAEFFNDFRAMLQHGDIIETAVVSANAATTIQYLKLGVRMKADRTGNIQVVSIESTALAAL